MDKAVIGLDVGTTVVKGVATDGQRLFSAVSTPISMLCPEPGQAEQDPEAIWSRTCDVIRSLVAELDGTAVGGLSVAAQSGSVMAIDSVEQPLTNAITWADERALGVVERWQATGQAREMAALSGWTTAPGLGAAIIAWLARHETELFADAARFVGVDSFVTHRLTDRWTTNPSNAAGMQLLDVRSGEWSTRLCALVGVEHQRLAVVSGSGAFLGSVTAKAAEATGLAAGTPVVNGGHDQTCAAFSLGLIGPSQVLMSCGTAWVLTGVLSRPDHAAEGFSLSRHVVDGRWTASQFVGGFGAAMERLLGRFPEHRGVSGDRFDRLAEDLAGVEWPTARPLDDKLEDSHPATVDDIAAVMEVAALATAEALEVTAAAVPEALGVTLVGGSMRNPRWAQLLADAAGVTVTVAEGDSHAASGAARLAAHGIGLNIPVSSDGPEAQMTLRAVDPQRFAARRSEYREWLQTR